MKNTVKPKLVVSSYLPLCHDKTCGSKLHSHKPEAYRHLILLGLLVSAVGVVATFTPVKTTTPSPPNVVWTQDAQGSPVPMKGK